MRASVAYFSCCFRASICSPIPTRRERCSSIATPPPRFLTFCATQPSRCSRPIRRFETSESKKPPNGRWAARSLPSPHCESPKLLFFKHEERPILVYPEKLVVGRAQRDELNRDRLKLNVAFTLPPGSYATLVIRRLFHFCYREESAQEITAARASLLEPLQPPSRSIQDRRKIAPAQRGRRIKFS